jgi:sugar O-acyltransferase (sialic acid O-acetyltransferase NeuD family)
MLIIGAKGFAKEVLEICHQNNQLDSLAFYDDVNVEIGDSLFGKFPIIKNTDDAKKYFEEVDARFTIGIGNPELRRKLFYRFSGLGGVFTTTISTTAIMGHYGNIIGEGSNIMINAVLTNDISIGKGTIINQLSSLGHDLIIGEFCEICPNVSISGNCEIGEMTFIGTGAIILPKVKIGKNVIIGAGALVTKNIPDNCVAFGSPAKIIKELEPLKF